MLHECIKCGYITNDNNIYKNHKCREETETVVERFLRCLADINIYPKRYNHMNLLRTK